LVSFWTANKLDVSFFQEKQICKYATFDIQESNDALAITVKAIATTTGRDRDIVQER
jgi:hypothetical protein